MIAVATVITFSAYKISSVETKALVSVPVYFHGNPANSAEVADESKWTTTSNGQSCSGNNLACMISVENTDLIGAQLDPAKVNLIAVPGAAGPGFVPQRASGSGTPNPTITNRN